MSEIIDNEIKIAQRDKFLVEIKKLQVEKEKIEFKNDITKKKSKIKWFVKSKFWTQLSTIFLGVGILGFYIQYVIEPASKVDKLNLAAANLENKIKNLEDQENLGYLRKQLSDQKAYADAINLEKDNLSDSISQYAKNIAALTIEGKSKDIIQKNNKQLNTFIKQQEQSYMPEILGKWNSTIYPGKETWDIGSTSQSGLLTVTLTTPGYGKSTGIATYSGNGKFIINLNLKANGELLNLQYTWTVKEPRPTIINSTFSVVSSNVDRTPVGTMQSDKLVKDNP